MVPGGVAGTTEAQGAPGRAAVPYADTAMCRVRVRPTCGVNVAARPLPPSLPPCVRTAALPSQPTLGGRSALHRGIQVIEALSVHFLTQFPQPHCFPRLVDETEAQRG